MVKILIDLDDKDYQIIGNQTRFLGGHGGRIIKAIHEGTVLPSYPTNGDVISALFPNEGDFETDFDESWWNAPYKGDK